MTQRINASAAIVYILEDGRFLVQVWDDQRRWSNEYVMDTGGDEDKAAMGAIDKFVEEHQDV